MSKTEMYSDQITRLFPQPETKAGKFSAPRSVTWQVTDACNLKCTYCVTGDSLVTMANYEKKPIKNIEIGDSVLGFTEIPEKGCHTKVFPAEVSHIFKRTANIYEVALENGHKLNITGNHKVLVSRNSAENHKYDFRAIEDLTPGGNIYFLPIAELPDILEPEENEQYQIGYLTGMLKGDGFNKSYITKEGYNTDKFRLTVVDDEIIQRTKMYLDNFNFDTYLKPYEVSVGNHLIKDAIFSNKESTYIGINKLFEDNFGKNNSIDYLKGFLAGIYDTEGHISPDDRGICITNISEQIILEIERALKAIEIPFIRELRGSTKNKEHKWNVRIADNNNALNSFKFLKLIKSALLRKSLEKFWYYSPLERRKIVSITKLNEEVEVYNIETTSGTYIANGFAVHNCYQIAKQNHVMSWDVAKAFCDMLLAATPENNSYINPEISSGLIMEFIGGEPFLAIDLIDRICDYMILRMIELQHPWATRFMISICSNGVLYFDERVQKFMEKHKNHLSFSISIDGCKELHDACRVFPDGSGSYDIAIAGVHHFRDHFNGKMGSKMTLAPENIVYTFTAVKNLIEEGYDEINLNCVYEEGWTPEHARILYDQLCSIADYLLENDLDDKVALSIFEEHFFCPKKEDDVQNWCWGAGTPILTTKGFKNIEDIKIGDMVYTEDGTIHPVINTMSHEANNVVKISGSGFFDMICTDNHQLYARPFDHMGNRSIKHYKPYGKYQVKDLNGQAKLKMFDLPMGKVSVDKDLAYLVGRYVGDGWDYQNSNGHSICCAFKEKDELITAFKNAKVNYHLDENKTVYQFSVDRRNKNENTDEFTRLAQECGHLAHNKHFPAECMSWDKPSIEALLNGYLDADGTYNNTKGQCRCNTASYQLAQELLFYLKVLGYLPTCYKNKRGGKSEIQDREVIIQDRYEIYYYTDTAKNKYLEFDENGKSWTAHLAIEPVESQIVYNITVDTNHSYIAGNLVSANCGGLGLMLSCDWKGDLYPCIRYMESSLGADRQPIIIGNVFRGITQTEEEKQLVACMECVNRRTQSTDECFYCPIAEGCSWCFPAGTKVLTPEGYRNIEVLKIGDKVIDGDGNVQVVENNLIRQVQKDELTSIKASGMLETIVTNEHPYWVKKVEKRHSNKPIYGEPKWVEAKYIKPSDKIALFIPNFGTKDVDKAMAYLVGRYIGDGWKTASNRLLHPFKYYLCGSFDEQEEIEKYFDLAGIKATKNLNKTVAEYNINITNNEYFISLIDDCGLNAKEKHIPREVMHWNRESLEALLKGYFDADGCYDKKSETRRFTSISYQLILDIAELVRMVYHKNVNITIRNPKPITKIDGREVNQSISYEGRYKVTEPLRKYYEYDEKNNIMWINVATSELEPIEELAVYNLTVSNSHTFIANGAIVHNCSAYNYQNQGSFDKRATHICIMHKARALANAYFYNMAYLHHNIPSAMKLHIPEEWALEIIDQEEWTKLKTIEQMAMDMSRLYRTENANGVL